jgi:hypothetical protein
MLMNANLFLKSAKTFLLLVSFFLFFQISDAQTNITVWDFESMVSISSPSPSIGAGTANVIGGLNTASSAAGNGTVGGCGGTLTGQGWQFLTFNPGIINETNGVEFLASTSGYDTIKFTWDQRWTNTSPNTVRLQYTTDGTTWINFVMTAGNTTFCNGSINSNGCFEADTATTIFRRTTVDFSAIPAVNNNVNFGVRLLAAFYQSTTDFRQQSAPATIATNTGTWRFDNVTFSGNLLGGPTPSVISGSTTVCGATTLNIAVAITGGISPFTLIYNDSVLGNVTINNYVSGTPISVTPASTRNYTIVSVANSSNGALGTANSGTAAIVVNPLVTITSSATTAVIPAKCYSVSAQTTTLAYSATTGAPNNYSITWNASPSNTFAPITLATLSSSPITINIPAGTAAGVYTGYLVVKNTTTTCESAIKPFTLTIGGAPTNTTPPSSVSQTVCLGDSFSPINVVYANSPVSYQWYRNTQPSTTTPTPVALTGASYPTEIAAGSKTATFTPLSNAVGTFYYFTKSSNGCGTSVYSPISGVFTVLPLPTATMSSAQTICSGYAPSDLTLTALGTNMPVNGTVNTISMWQRADDAAFTTNIINYLITSTTLTGATIGNLTQTTYFRAFITNGTCTRTTTPIQISVKTTTYQPITGWDNGLPDSTTTAIFNANFSSTADINACKVIVTNGAVTINSNHSLIVQNGVNVTSGSLTFENNASLVQINPVANVGTIIYKRDSTLMNVYDYTFWSSPVLNQNLYTFSPGTLGDKYFYWDSTPSVYNWSVILNGAANMDIGKGYIIRSPLFFGYAASIFNGTFTGIPNNGNYTTPIEVSGALNANNNNLIGNPYPSALDATSFLNANGSVIEKTIYLWSHNTPVNVTTHQYNANDYATFDLTGGVGTLAATNTGINNNVPNGSIAAGQGFFVLGKNLGINSVSFNNTMRLVGNNNRFFRGTNTVQTIEKHRLWLELSNSGGAFSQTLFGYIEGATNAKDNGYDSILFDDSPTASFYSVLNNEKLTIKGNALPFVETDTNQLGYISRAETDYEIRLALFDGVFDTQNVYLQDNLLGIVHDLRQSNYSFNSAIGTFNDRFVLRFTNTSLSNSENQFNDNNITVFNNNSIININSNLEKMQSISVFDVSGRLIYSKSEIDKNNFNIETLKSSKQVLFVQIKLNNGIFVNKKIIF